jgi:hypothetical protein
LDHSRRRTVGSRAGSRVASASGKSAAAGQRTQEVCAFLPEKTAHGPI